MPKIVDYEARRREIASKAVSVFVNEGFHNANLSTIAELCGFGRTSVYKYFKDKNEIYAFAMKEIFLRMQNRVGEIVTHAEWSSKQKLDELINALIKSSVDDRERTLLIMKLCLDQDPKDLESETKQQAKQLLVVFQKVLDEGISSGEFKPIKSGPMAFALFSLLEGFMIQSSFFQDFSYDEAMEAVHSLLDGLVSAKKTASAD